MDNQDSNPTSELDSPDATATGASSSSTAAPRPNSTGKKKSAAAAAPAPDARVGQSYRLSQQLDWAIRYAALMLEQQDGQRRSQQDLVDTAVRESLDRMRKKGMSFPDNIDF